MFKPVSLSGADSAGLLFSDGTRYLRGIVPAAADAMRGLLGSGLIDALCRRQLVPATKVLDAGIPDALQGYAMVLEHEAVRPVTYPREWSFGMVKAAGLAFLEILEEAAQRGYTCKDAHLFNFAFQGMRPVWLDIGSFVRSDSLPAPAPWLAEFNAVIAAPLRMWADGSSYLARCAIRHPTGRLPADEFLAYRHPLLRGHSSLARGARWLLAARRNAASIQEQSRRATLFKALFAVPPAAAVRRSRSLIAPLRCPPSSAWGGYQDDYVGKDGEIDLTGRFARVVELVAQHRPASVVELAGNSGVVSQAIAQRLSGAHVTCTDYDAVAIDRLFERASAAALPNLSAAVLDFMVPEYTSAELAPDVRFAGDCVLALAITHHLLLTQGYDYDTVLRAIRAYTRDLAFIEFMPLGLHDGKSAPPLPGWYGLAGFTAAFSRHFEQLHTEQLDDNRILLVGRARASQG